MTFIDVQIGLYGDVWRDCRDRVRRVRAARSVARTDGLARGVVPVPARLRAVDRPQGGRGAAVRAGDVRPEHARLLDLRVRVAARRPRGAHTGAARRRAHRVLPRPDGRGRRRQAPHPRPEHHQRARSSIPANAGRTTSSRSSGRTSSTRSGLASQLSSTSATHERRTCDAAARCGCSASRTRQSPLKRAARGCTASRQRRSMCDQPRLRAEQAVAVDRLNRLRDARPAAPF